MRRVRVALLTNAELVRTDRFARQVLPCALLICVLGATVPDGGHSMEMSGILSEETATTTIPPPPSTSTSVPPTTTTSTVPSTTTTAPPPPSTIPSTTTTAPPTTTIPPTTTVPPSTTTSSVPPSTTTTTTIPSEADVSVTKVASPAAPEVSAPFDYVITVTNEGPQAASIVELIDDLPPGFGLQALEVSLDGVACRANELEGHVTCTVSSLDPGGSFTVMVTVTVSTPGTFLNTATVMAASPPDPNSANDSATVVTIVSLGGSPP